MIWATNIGSVLTSINRNIKAKSPFQGWWLLHCKASFSNQRRKVFRGGETITKGQRTVRLSDTSCLLTGQKGHAGSHEKEDYTICILTTTLQRPHLGANLISGSPWLLVSQLLFYCFLWFPNRTEELYICFVGKPAYFFTLLFHPFREALFYSYLLLSFSFKCRIAWQRGVPGK